MKHIQKLNEKTINHRSSACTFISMYIYTNRYIMNEEDT